MKIIRAARFNELYDFFDDNTVQEYANYLRDDTEAIDYDALERGEIPFEQVTEENVDEYLADNYPEEEEISFEEKMELPYREPEITEEEIPEFSSTEEAMAWAIKNRKIVRINYITKGKGHGRGGYILQREIGLKSGAEITRVIEPYYMFQAKNGNLILVTYDRSVRHIRAFIVPNIVNYIFTGKEIKKRRSGIKVMNTIDNRLVKVASELKKEQLHKSASIVKDAIKTLADLKIAQYVGVQGYWLRNRRCWDNCYRHKRTTQPDTPAQEVWMSCWEEYKDSINNDKSGWEKYAAREENVKLTKEEEKAWNELFAKKIEEKVKSGSTTPEAVYGVIEEQSQKYTDKVIESSSNLMTMAETLNENGYKGLGEELADVSVEMLKEAGIWDTVKNVGRGIKDWWSKSFGSLKSVIDKLDRLNILANDVLRSISRSRTMGASDEKAIKEAQATIPNTFRSVYNLANQTMRDLSTLVSQVPANSLVAQYLDAGMDNLGLFINDYDTQVQNRSLTINTMIPLLQKLNTLTIQAKRGITAVMQNPALQEEQLADPEVAPAPEAAPETAPEVGPEGGFQSPAGASPAPQTVSEQLPPASETTPPGTAAPPGTTPPEAFNLNTVVDGIPDENIKEVINALFRKARGAGLIDRNKKWLQ